MGLLARKADGVSLDAELHRPERQVHPLQNGTLLDVQLEVGDGVLGFRLASTLSSSTPYSSSASGSAMPRCPSGCARRRARARPRPLPSRRGCAKAGPSSSAQSTRRSNGTLSSAGRVCA